MDTVKLDQILVINGRLRLWRQVSSGAGGAVYLGDTLAEPERPVAIKVIPIPPESDGRRLLEPIARLVSLRHPNLNSVNDFGVVKRSEMRPFASSGHRWSELLARYPPASGPQAAPGAIYLVAPFLGGGDLSAAIARFRGEGPSTAKLDRWLSGVTLQILAVLRYLHDLAIIHFDVKPDHILVSDNQDGMPGIPHVGLIDLGLSARESTPLGNRVRGTFPYMAPEVLENSLVDQRVDLYSLGATLYRALTGDPHLRNGSDAVTPAAGGSTATVERLAELPAFWRGCIQRLLERDPDLRYPSAAALMDEIRRRPAAADLKEPTAAIGAMPRLIGHEKEFDYIARELEKLKLGDAAHTLILLGGETGLGKRMVARRLVESARLEGIETFAIRCLARLDGPLDPLLRLFTQLRQHPLTPPALTPEIDLLIGWMRDGAPPPEDVQPTLAEHHENNARMRARIVAVINSLDPSEPYLLLFEDLHNAAPELVECLGLIAYTLHLRAARISAKSTEDYSDGGRGGGDDGDADAESRPAPVRVLILATAESLHEHTSEYRIASERGGFSIRQLLDMPHVSRVALKPLTPVRAKELVREVLGPSHLTAPTHNELYELSGGRWQSLIELLRDCQYYGHLVREPHGWVWRDPRFEPRAIAQLRTSEWQRLDANSRAFLSVLALTGGSLPAPEAELALGTVAAGVIPRLLEQQWIDEERAETGVSVFSLARPTEELDAETHNARRALLERLARHHLELRPDHPVSAMQLLLEANDTKTLPGLVSSALESLRRLHCEISIIDSIERLRALLGGSVEPEWILCEAEAFGALGQWQKALAAAEQVLASSASPALRINALRVASHIHRRQGKLSLAGRRLEEALKLAAELGHRDIEVELLVNKGWIQLERNDLERALETAARAEERLRGDPAENRFLTDATLFAQIRQLIAAGYARQNLHSKATATLEGLLAEAGSHLPQPWIARLRYQMGQIAFSHAHYDEALGLWERCLAIEKGHWNLIAVALLETELGRIYFHRAELVRALLHYRRSLHIREEIGDRYGIGTCYNNLGLVYRDLGRIAAAESAFLGCLSIFEELGQPEKQATVLNNLSDLMLAKGDSHVALKYAMRGLEKRRALTDQRGIAWSYDGIATVYEIHGELDRAADYAEKSLEIRRELGDKLGIAHSLRKIGMLHLLRAQYYEAFRAFRQSLGNFEAIGDTLGRTHSIFGLGRLFQLMGQYEDAAGYFDLSLKSSRDAKAELDVHSALHHRAALFIELGELAAAEAELNEAERFHRRGPVRRDLVEVLLTRARLAMELGNRERALAVLAETYSHLEKLGLLDLFPVYYWLRGTLAAEGETADPPVARKLLERGLEEAQRLDLLELSWQILYSLYRVEAREGMSDTALRHLDQAQQTLHRIHSRLPTQFLDTYLKTSARAELLAEWESSGRSLVEAELASPQPEAPAPVPVVAHEAAQVADLLRLQEITVLLTSERSLKALLDRIMDIVLELFHAERGYVILADREQHEIAVARNLDREDVDHPSFKYSQSIARQVLATGETFITNDALNDERLRDSASVHDLRLQAIACFPLEWQGQRIGLVYLENRFNKRLIDATRVRLLEAFSSQAAVAITNARLNEENERRRLELEASEERVRELNRRLEQRVEEQSRELEVAKREIQVRQHQLEDRFRFHNILGQSPQMQHLYRVLEKVAVTDLPVLIEGESGTGKELVARAVHFNSGRRREVFLSENCGAIAESLFESELFGHVKGAFTGAAHDRDGLFGLAEGGTLFLDEIHELSLDLQKKLLRVLQEGEYRPVGGKKVRIADVRILTASNQPLLKLVRENRFREDLYYRLNVLKVELPPLRDRDQDILLLARHFLTRICEKEKLGEKRLSPASLALLAQYSYPGNVRELMNIVEKAAILSTGVVIEPDVIVLDGVQRPLAAVLPGIEELEGVSFRTASERFQRTYLLRTLRDNGMVVARAARSSGITRESFHRLMKKHGIQRDRDDGDEPGDAGTR